MIKDPAKLKDMQEDWRDVSNLRGMSIRTGLTFITSMKVAVVYENVLLIIAYGVLQKVLSQFEKEGVFSIPQSKKSKKNPALGTLMNASKTKLNWLDYNLIWTGKQKRDGVAHEGQYILRNECATYIDAIGRELKSWGIIQ